MANCSNCKVDVGCPCNLHNTLCVSCYSKGITPPARSSKIINQIVSTENERPITVFTMILGNKELTREEKLNRINKILEGKNQDNE